MLYQNGIASRCFGPQVASLPRYYSGTAPEALHVSETQDQQIMSERQRQDALGLGLLIRNILSRLAGSICAWGLRLHRLHGIGFGVLASTGSFKLYRTYILGAVTFLIGAIPSFCRSSCQGFIGTILGCYIVQLNRKPFPPQSSATGPDRPATLALAL